MGMSRYYRNIFGVPKDGTPPPPPEEITVVPPPMKEEVEVVVEEPVVEVPPERKPKFVIEDKPEKAIVIKKIGDKKKK
jgi:hypothetical protein